MVFYFMPFVSFLGLQVQLLPNQLKLTPSYRRALLICFGQKVQNVLSVNVEENCLDCI